MRPLRPALRRQPGEGRLEDGPASLTTYCRAVHLTSFLSQAARFSRSPLSARIKVMLWGSTATKTGRLWKKISSGQAIVTRPLQHSSKRFRTLPAAASAAKPQRWIVERAGAVFGAQDQG